MKLKKLSLDIIRRHKGISFPGVTTVFFCHDGQGKLLLTKRSKNTRDEHGRWDVGGGGLKFGQALEENLYREIREEYNLDAVSTEFIGYIDAFRTNKDGMNTHWVAMCFAVQVDPSKLRINEPEMVDDHGWFDLEELPNPMHSQFEVFYKKHGEKLEQILKPRGV